MCTGIHVGSVFVRVRNDANEQVNDGIRYMTIGRIRVNRNLPYDASVFLAYFYTLYTLHFVHFTLCTLRFALYTLQRILLDIHRIFKPYISRLTVQVEKDVPLDWLLPNK